MKYFTHKITQNHGKVKKKLQQIEADPATATAPICCNVAHHEGVSKSPHDILLSILDIDLLVGGMCHAAAIQVVDGAGGFLLHGCDG